MSRSVETTSPVELCWRLKTSIRGRRLQFTNLATKFVAIARSREGATAIEYGLIIGGISIAILATVFAIGNELDFMFSWFGELIHDRLSNMDN